MNPETVQALTGWVPRLAPELVLVAAACILFLGATVRPDRLAWNLFTLASLAAAAVVAWFGPHASPPTAADLFASPLHLDTLAWITRGLALAGGAVLLLVSWHDIPHRHTAEYNACLLVVVAGAALTGLANDLVVLFLALEMVSIPTYVMLYLPRHDEPAQEAAMKYFLLSVFSSALALFGLSYLYGLTGTTNLPALTEALATAGPTGLPAVALAALVLVVAGLGFRITAVPFHFYAPDVYQGTATPMAAFLAYIPKVAGFVALIRLLGYLPQPHVLADMAANKVTPGLVLGPQASTLFWILAAVTMTLGNVLALLQDDLKRLLAYSSVAHAGYMILGLAVAPYLRASGAPVPGGVEAVLFYLAAYGAMTLGAFAVIVYLDSPSRHVRTVDDLAGLSRSHPLVALALALFLFSLIGIPLTAGFAGKLLLFLGALAVRPELGDPTTLEQARLFRILAVIMALNAAIGGWYYLRICAAMYLRNPLHAPTPARKPAVLVAVALCAVVTLVLGVYPWSLLRSIIPAARPPAVAQAER